MPEVIEGVYKHVKVRPDIKVRMGLNSEGLLIQALCVQNGFPLEGVDWSDIEPCWLVAIYEGEMVGALQLSFGKPLSVAELLCLKPGMPKRLRVLTLNELLYNMVACWKNAGASIGVCFITFDNKDMRQFLKRFGLKQLASGNLLGINLGR